MDQFQVCGQLVGNCSRCIASNCLYVQFLSGHWSCIDKLAGWRDIVRVIAPHFQEMCANLMRFESADTVTTAPFTTSLSLSCTNLYDEKIWIMVLGLVQFISILVMSICFWILFSRDERLVRAIESIPVQIQELYRHQNNQFNQIQPENDNAVFSDDEDDDVNSRNMNPFIPIHPLSNNIAQAHPPREHQQIEMEPRVNDYDDSYSDDETEEVLPREGIITKFGRMIRRPIFFGR